MFINLLKCVYLQIEKIRADVSPAKIDNYFQNAAIHVALSMWQVDESYRKIGKINILWHLESIKVLTS